MGDMDSFTAASDFTEGCSPKDPPIRNTRWLSPRLALSAISRANSSLERGVHSTHTAMT